MIGIRHARKDALLVGLFMLLASCGGGGNGGISGTGIVYGPITGFGSVIVNGTEFDVTDAEISIEGVPALESDLRLGMLVTIRGVLDQGAGVGTADSVDADTTLRGPVDSIDVAAREITVLGQLVRTNANTIFDGTTLETLLLGNIVEVSGLNDSSDGFLATRIELEDDAEEFEIEGRIQNLDTVAETFAIGALLVDYSSAEIEGAPATGLENGLLVEAESSQPPVNNVLLAEEVEVRTGDVGGDEGEEASVDGLVTALLGPNRFVVNRGQVVRVTSATRYEGGNASDVAVNVRVEVEGVLDASSEIVAEKVEFEDD
jgi:hypothetical protein